MHFLWQLMAMTLRGTKAQRLAFAKSEFNKIADSIEKSSIDKRSLQTMESIQLMGKSFNRKRFMSLALLAMVMTVVTLYSSPFGMYTKEGFVRFWFWWRGLYRIEDHRCVIRMSSALQNAFMRPFDCNVCEHLENVTKVSNLTPEEFSERYAYRGVPIVVTDAMTNWTAPEVFSFKFFKEIYPKESRALSNYHSDCQFFPYRTEFKSLSDVFSMSVERANLEDGREPWYVGWSNCDSSVANILRQHYERPYFLPLDSEGTRTDWIFMGSPGYGAHMHIDHVGDPSWQAQVKGRKLWTLEAPPECYLTCNTLSVIVEPGEMIILDTNKWYHKTQIIGNEISITIGSEYD